MQPTSYSATAIAFSNLAFTKCARRKLDDLDCTGGTDLVAMEYYDSEAP